jgi:pilus assembly protein Flp/PilA
MSTHAEPHVGIIDYMSIENCFQAKEDGMSRYIRIMARWFGVESEEGVTAIEYGLIAALIALAIITAATAIGTDLAALFNRIATTLTTVGT